MTGYEEFQRIMAELKAKIESQKKINVPLGFEELFNQFKK